MLGVPSLGPWYFLHADAIGISEAARAVPGIVAVPYSLSSGVNRFLYYGFPLLPNSVYLDGNPFPQSPTSLSGTDGVFATQLSRVSANGPAGLDAAGVPSSLVIPQTELWWENGVFSENVLGVKFQRPLTGDMDFALFSNYRYFAPYTYSTAGDMTSLFESFISDTSLLQNGGRNPLSSETNMSLAVTSHGGPWEKAWLTYSYEDTKNDLAIQNIDTVTGVAKLQWESLWRFANTVRAQLRSLPVGKLMLNADGRAVWEGHTALVPSANSLISDKKTGRNADIALSFEPFLPLGADTIALTAAGQRQEHGLYDGSKAAAYAGSARAGWRRGFRAGGLSASVKASIGDGVVVPQGSGAAHSLVYSAEGSATLAGQSLRLFAVRDHLPFVLPFDTISEPMSSYFNVYNAYGGELYLGWKKAGIALGACGAAGVDTTAAARYWPGGVMPYRQPNVAVMVAPMLGRWLGLALGSRVIVSDVKPYLKAQATLSYVAQPLGVSEHLTVDLVYDYWSGRDPLSYGGNDLWSREIDNLSLRMAVHIRTFNIFYKVDNVLDRKFAYVPGYFMPGITFRWGFGWLIQ